MYYIIFMAISVRSNFSWSLRHTQTHNRFELTNHLPNIPPLHIKCLLINAHIYQNPHIAHTPSCLRFFHVINRVLDIHRPFLLYIGFVFLVYLLLKDDNSIYITCHELERHILSYRHHIHRLLWLDVPVLLMKITRFYYQRFPSLSPFKYTYYIFLYRFIKI
jgi:hypothetical protein